MRESVTLKFACSSVAFALAGTLVLTLAGSWSAEAARPTEEPVSGVARVLDGDTLDIGGTRVRLEGIDAPELGQSCSAPGGGTWPCGVTAASALEKLIGNNTIECVREGIDKYGRTLAVCRAGGRDLNAEMVRAGLAWAFVRYSQRYVAIEDDARRAARGIWRSATDPAWVYREQQWAGAQTDAPKGCAIKGNISSKGQIYHMPWSPWYKRVKVDPSRGERWFCSEADAEAAGWRPALAH